MMYISSDASFRDPIGDSKFHNHSTSTNLFTPQDTNNITNLHSSIQTNPQETNPPSLEILPLSKEILQITHRFERIQQVLLQHSERESSLHEKVFGLKQLPIDWQQLSPDLTNKISILEDLRHLVSVAEQSNSQDIRELLESKFQEYYLQRHYGGLKCDVHDLSIQERGEDLPQAHEATSAPFDYQQMGFGYAQSSGSAHSSCSHQEGRTGGKLICLSSLQKSEESLEYINLKVQKRDESNKIALRSLANESKLTYTEDCCQTNEGNYSIYLEVPHIIEVQIPFVVYRVKQKVITYDQSDLEAPYRDIDEIIDKYSKPYQELYQQRHGKANSQLPSPSLRPMPSLQLASNLHEQRQPTEVDLTYSHLPDQQLLLDSYAQIDSLISHSDYGERHREKQNMSVQAENHIIITEKLNSHSILEKYQQSERALNQENIQLKEALQRAQRLLQQSERKCKEAAATSARLAARLQEQIEQGLYLSNKLDELDAEILQEKVQCLTRLADCKDRKIDSLSNQLAQKQAQIEAIQSRLREVAAQAESREEKLIHQQEQLKLLAKHLQERQMQLNELACSGNDMIARVGTTELQLRAEIEKLQQQKIQLKHYLSQIQKRIQSEGLNLRYEEAKEIQGIIEEREHHFSLQLQQIHRQYSQKINAYQQELDEARQNILITQEKLQTCAHDLSICQLAHKQEMQTVMLELFQAQQQNKSQLHLTCVAVDKKMPQNFLAEFQSVIQEYDRQLQIKDEEIMNLKQSLPADEQLQQQHLKSIIAIVNSLNLQLQNQRQEKTMLTHQLVQMDQMLASQSARTCQQQSQIQKYNGLLEQLTLKMQTLLRENSLLKDKMLSSLQSSRAQAGQDIETSRKQVQKLRKVCSRLKKYTLEMQNELISISGMNRCESHKQILAGLAEERNYYVSMLAGS